ncbi:MAG: hypothetical protein R3E39_26530 [Anaerolineae bacterium]
MRRWSGQLIEKLGKSDNYLLALIVGVFLSPFLSNITSPLFDTPTKVVYLSISFMIVALAVFIIGQKRSINRIETLQEDIVRRVGMSIEYLTGQSSSDRTVYKRMTTLIDAAEESIYILDYLPRPYHLSAPKGKERTGYYAALNRAIDKNLFFKRVVQIPNQPASDFISTSNMNMSEESPFIEHCRKILNTRNKKYANAKASLKSSVVVLPESTLVILDEQRVAWAVTIHSSDGTSTLQGVLLIDDMQGEFVKYLVQLFNGIDGQAVPIKDIIQ